MMKSILYIVFTLIFLLIFYFFVKKGCNSKSEKIFVTVHTILLLLSASYHIFYFDNDHVYQVAKDQYYYTNYGHTSSFPNFKCILTKILKYSYGNVQYTWLYGTILNITPQNYFYVAIYFISLCNAFVHLLALFILIKILNELKISNFFKSLNFILITIVMFFSTLRDAMPLANACTVFSLVFYLYVIYKHYNNIFLNLLALFLLYLSHKIYYICVPVLFMVYIISSSKKYKFIFLTFFLLMILFAIKMPSKIIPKNPRKMLSYSIYERNNVSNGNSSIPRASIIQKILNSWYCPFITNTQYFLYKAPSGNTLGWIFALSVNIVYMMFSISILYNIRYFKYLDKPQKRLTMICILLICLLSVAFCYISNYLNLNRHSTNVFPIWIILLATLRAGKPRRNNNLLSSKQKSQRQFIH